MAGDERLLYDLAVTLAAWCWKRRPELDERGELDLECAASLFAGYQHERPLDDDERASLRAELRYATLRFTASRLVDFELPRDDDDVDRDYLDYRDFLARFEAVTALTDDHLDAMLRSPR